jgi:hypothetical protein
MIGNRRLPVLAALSRHRRLAECRLCAQKPKFALFRLRLERVLAPARSRILSPFQFDLPCPVVTQKIFRFTLDPNHLLIPCHPVPYEGRFAIVTDVRRDAVDAEALLTNSA